MTKFEAPSFSVSVGGSQAYRDNWERIFGKNKGDEGDKPKSMDELPAPREAQPSPEPPKPKKTKKKSSKKPKKAKESKES